MLKDNDAVNKFVIDLPGFGKESLNFVKQEVSISN